MPYAVAAVLAGWMTIYGRRTKRSGERLAAAAEAEHVAAAEAEHVAAAEAEREAAADAERLAALAERLIPETAGTAGQAY
jgi:hypothetical protein